MGTQGYHYNFGIPGLQAWEPRVTSSKETPPTLASSLGSQGFILVIGLAPELNFSGGLEIRLERWGDAFKAIHIIFYEAQTKIRVVPDEQGFKRGPLAKNRA